MEQQRYVLKKEAPSFQVTEHPDQKFEGRTYQKGKVYTEIPTDTKTEKFSERFDTVEKANAKARAANAKADAAEPKRTPTRNPKRANGSNSAEPIKEKEA